MGFEGNNNGGKDMNKFLIVNNYFSPERKLYDLCPGHGRVLLRTTSGNMKQYSIKSVNLQTT